MFQKQATVKINALKNFQNLASMQKLKPQKLMLLGSCKYIYGSPTMGRSQEKYFATPVYLKRGAYCLEKNSTYDKNMAILSDKSTK